MYNPPPTFIARPSHRDVSCRKFFSLEQLAYGVVSIVLFLRSGATNHSALSTEVVRALSRRAFQSQSHQRVPLLSKRARHRHAEAGQPVVLSLVLTDTTRPRSGGSLVNSAICCAQYKLQVKRVRRHTRALVSAHSSTGDAGRA